MVLLSINESLVKAMVRCIDEKLEGLTTLVGRLGRKRLMGLKNGSRIPDLPPLNRSSFMLYFYNDRI